MNPILPEEMRNLVELLEAHGLPDDARRLGLYLDQQERAEEDTALLDWMEKHPTFSSGRIVCVPEAKPSHKFLFHVGLERRKIPAENIREAIQKARKEIQ